MRKNVQYTVITHKRGDPTATLFMVDRRVQRASFWSDRLDDVKWFDTLDGAEAARRKLRFNNPRVVDYYVAQHLARANEERREGSKREFHFGGWDDHKSQF